jgi:hypothetical protein
MLKSHLNLVMLMKQVDEESEEGTHDLVCD